MELCHRYAATWTASATEFKWSQREIRILRDPRKAFFPATDKELNRQYHILLLFLVCTTVFGEYAKCKKKKSAPGRETTVHI